MQSFEATKAVDETDAGQTGAARALAPEEIQIGDYVAQLFVTYDLPSYLWNTCDTSLRPHELVRLQLMPATGGTPLKVISVCLPFVIVKTPTGDPKTLDIRQTTLARLDTHYAKASWKALKKTI